MSDHDIRYIAWIAGDKGLLADEAALARFAQARGIAGFEAWQLDDNAEVINHIYVQREGDTWVAIIAGPDGLDHTRDRIHFPADPSNDPRVLAVVDSFCRPLGGGREWDVIRYPANQWPPTAGTVVGSTDHPAGVVANVDPRLVERYARYGYLPPAGMGGAVHLCPDVVAATTAELDDSQLESYLATIDVRVSMFARFPHIDDVDALEHICDNAIYDIGGGAVNVLSIVEQTVRSLEEAP